MIRVDSFSNSSGERVVVEFVIVLIVDCVAVVVVVIVVDIGTVIVVPSKVETVCFISAVVDVDSDVTGVEDGDVVVDVVAVEVDGGRIGTKPDSKILSSKRDQNYYNDSIETIISEIIYLLNIFFWGGGCYYPSAPNLRPPHPA